MTTARRAVAVAILGSAIGLGAGPALADRVRAETHMGPNAEAKCRAFRKVMTDTQALQTAHGGSLPTAARLRLQHELTRAHAKPPRQLTPRQCGLPL